MANLSNINNKFLVTTGGNVGINTTSPAEKLEVSGGHIKIINSGNTNLYINANNSGSDSTIFFQETNSTKAKIQHDASNDSMLFTDGAYTDTMTLKGGKVGIGTTSPTNPLSVEATNVSDWVAEFKQGHSTAGQSYGVNIFGGTSSSDAAFQVCNQAGGGLLRVTGAGNVGIGTSSPNEKLDITGGYLKFNGGDYGLKGSASLTYNPVSDHYFQSSGSTKVTFKASGNVGIATTSPIQKLDTPNIIIGGSTIAGGIYRANSTMMDNLGGIARFYSIGPNTTTGGSYQFNSLSSNATAGAGTVMTIFNTGNVGIATAININKLDVGGNINVQGGNGSYLTFNNGDANIVINNNGSGRDLSFKTYSGSSNAERMRIDKNGNVGIGTASPSAGVPLTVYYNSTSQFHIGGAQAGISNNVYYNGSAYVNRNTSTGGALLQLGTDGSFAFRRATSGSSPTLNYSQYIGANGNVGIGTTSPTATLQVTGDIKIGSGAGSGSDSNNMSIQVSNATYGDTSNLGLLVRNNGTNGQFAQIGFGYSESRCPVVIGSVITSGSGATKGDFIIGTRSTTTGSDAPTERMRITSGGNVGIGLTNPSWQLEVAKTGTVRAAISSIDNNTAGIYFRVFLDGNQVGNGTIATQNNGDMKFFNGTSSESEKMRIRASGTVGIGAAGFDSQMLTIAAGTLDGAIYATSTDANCFASFRDNSSTANIEYGAIGNAHVFRKDANEYMRIASNGRVGIGTTAPVALLHLKQAAGANIRFENGTTNRVCTVGEGVGTNDVFSFRGNSYRSTDTLSVVFSTDRVGIGIITPNEKLQVAGNIHAYAPSGIDAGLFASTAAGNTTAAVRSSGVTHFNGGNVGIGTTSPSAKLQVSNTDLNRKTMIQGNGTNQGFSHKATLVNHYPVVSAGNQLIIPFTSQGNLNSTTIIKIWGHSARFNSSDPRGFEATIQLGHLSALYNVSAISSSGNISGVSASGMNLVISFTTAYTNASLSDGLFATIEYMTNNLSYSLQPTNIVMN